MQAESIADILITSLNDLGRLKFTDLMSDYQNTIALKRIFGYGGKGKKVDVVPSGQEFQFNIITDHNNSARHVGLGYTSVIDIPNVMAVGKMPWRHTTWNWALERRLVAMNRGSSKIVDWAKTQRIASMGSAIILFEQTLWRCPTVAQFNDPDAGRPVGIPYFVVKSNTAFTDGPGGNYGFNGLTGSDHTLVANINPTTGANGRYRNYAQQFTDPTKDDLIRKMRQAFHYTDFKALVDDIPQYEVGQDKAIYTNYPTVQALEEILESQNDRLGTDVASMDGKVTFRRTPIVPVRELDNDTTDPVYGIDWATLEAKVLQGEWMHEQYFKSNPNQPTISMNNTDCTWNLACTNRRKNWVISKNTTMPA